MKKTGLILFLVLNFIMANGQKIDAGLEFGIGSYEMSDLKSLVSSVLASNPVEPKLISNFPSYFYYQPYLKFCRKNYNYGLSLGLQSTGARISIHDYSGEYLFNTQITGLSASVFGEAYLYKSPRWDMLVSIEAGGIHSLMSLNEKMIVLDSLLTKTDLGVNSWNLYLKPGVRVNYKLDNKVSVGAVIGYHVDCLAFPFVANNGQGYLNTSTGMIVAQWTGLRIGFSINYALKP